MNKIIDRKNTLLFETLASFKSFKFSEKDILNIQKNISRYDQLCFNNPSNEKCHICQGPSVCSLIEYNLCQICRDHIQSCCDAYHGK